MYLTELLSIYKTKQLDEFLERNEIIKLSENNLCYDEISKNWRFVGNSSSNASVINIVKNGEKGIIERITNAVDAVIEKQKKVNEIASADTSSDIIKIGFPDYYESRERAIKNHQGVIINEASDQVIVAINDSSKSTRPTFDIIDKGTGIKGKDFIDTIISINKGNKLTKDKSYLIGAFGQGGSTSLPFAEATMIISKFEGTYYYTIVKAVELKEYKNHAFVYLVFNDEIGEARYRGEILENEYLTSFVKAESGTLIRMIETDLSKELRENDCSYPGSFGDYVDTELFSVGMPVKLVENRTNFKTSANYSHYALGSFLKMRSWQFINDNRHGKIVIKHRNNQYSIDYYFILPEDESKWTNDTECKNVFRQINVHLTPIIYTVNGQLISSERFVKLKNAGLSFLQYRLLVVINLDILDMEKYKFFTSDRAQIRNSDLTHGFIDAVVERLKNEEKIIEMNNRIASKSMDSIVDNEIIKNISSKVKHIYNKYLQGNAVIKFGGNDGTGYTVVEKEEEIFYDKINTFTVTSTKKKYYKGQMVNVVLKTSANQEVNEKAKIKVMLDSNEEKEFIPSYMNGKIQYSFKDIKPGVHSILFKLTQEKKESELYIFEVLNELPPEKLPKDIGDYENKSLNLKILPVDSRELIIDIDKDINKKLITAYICLSHEDMDVVYGKSSINDVQLLKNKLIEPIVLFALSLGERYDEIETAQEKNELVVSLAKTITFSLMQK